MIYQTFTMGRVWKSFLSIKALKSTTEEGATKPRIVQTAEPDGASQGSLLWPGVPERDNRSLGAGAFSSLTTDPPIKITTCTYSLASRETVLFLEGSYFRSLSSKKPRFQV